MLPNLSSAATRSPEPLQSPEQLAFVGLKNWNGDSKPHFNLNQLQGGQGQLSQYRGRIVIVHFFATWCAGCHDEVTSLQRLTEQLKRRAIAVLAIDVADLDLRAKRDFDNNRVDFPILLDRDRETAKAWDVYSLPMTFLLDKSLSPKYWSEASLDWSRPEIIYFLHGLANQ
jgi:peroxiredoxin